MPNNLTATRDLFNWRDRELESHQRLVLSGFTASIWTLSGVVLAACDIFDDDGRGGNTLHVQKSPVQGARLYFDLDNDGDIDTADIMAQDAVFPQGFVTDAAGRAHNIPAIFQDLPFKAVLDGAIDADTGVALSGEMFSIPATNGAHRLASPITDFIVDDGRTPEQVIAALLPDADSAEITRILEAINDPRSYLGGDARIEALSFYVASLTNPTPDAVRSDAEKILNGVPTDPMDPNYNTLIIVNDDTTPNTDTIDLPAKTIGAYDSYIAKIQAVSHAGAVRYRIIEPADNEAFHVDRDGIISVVEGATLTDTTLRIEVSNGDESKIVSIAVTVAAAPVLNELPADATTATIMENVEGGTGTGTILISGITPTAPLSNPTWEIREANPAGLAALLDAKFAIVAAGNAYNLVLKDGASLDYDAIPRGVINLHVWVKENGVRSNALELRIQVETDPSEIDFGGNVLGIVFEDGNLIAQGRISVENQPENADVIVSSHGTYGSLEYADGTWTYTLDDSMGTRVDGLLSGEVLIDTATISVGGVRQNILIRINGADEDVHFVDNVGTRTADASVGVERGNPVLAGVDIFADLTLMNANLADIAVKFADAGENYNLFTISDAGLLTFTGTNEDVAGFGDSITLNLEITAPVLTRATLPFALQVNVINEVDDGRAEYEVTGDVELGQVLTVSRVQGSEDPDGVVGGVSFQWFRGDENAPTLLRTGERYRVTQDDIDSSDSIGVFVSYTDGSGTIYTHRDGNPDTTIVAFATPVKFTAPAAADRTINLDEDTAAGPTPHFSVTAESEDDDGNPVDIARYELLDENRAVVPDYKGFEIDSSSGAITLTGALDYETDTRITLRVRATDENTPAETATLILTVNVGDVNDNAPIFTPNQPTTATIPESQTAADGTILTITARDDDGTAPNNVVRYDITGGTGLGLFYIDENTGAIRVETGVDLNYDTTPATTRYTLEITASDGGDNPPADAMTATQMVIINLSDVNDIVPVVTPPPAGASFTVRTTATQGVSTTDTGTGYHITITDADTNNRFTFNVDDPRFDFIDRGNGVWELTLLANQDVPEAVASTITVNYQVHDGARNSANPGAVIFTVVDTPVEFTAPATRTINLAEDTTASNTPHFTVQARSDDGAGKAVDIDSYMFVNDNNVEATEYRGFTIDADSGAITLTGSLDHEDTHRDGSTINLRVRATDDNDETNTLMLTVNVGDVNEHAPVFTQSTYTAEIAETLAVDAEVVRVSASDADGTAENSNVRYDITGGNTGNVFDINPSSGVITLLNPLDYETATEYTLTITASDGTLTDTATVTINIRDINDESPSVPNPAPTGTARVTAAADNPVGTGMGYRISVSDDDAVNDFDVDIIAGDDRFEFRRQTGTNTWELFLDSGEEILPLELGTTITLTYQVTDGGVGTTPAAGTVTLTVVDTPVRFTAPTITTIPLEENNVANLAVATVTATSEDDAGATVHIQSFALVDDFGGLFSISTTGAGTASAAASITIADANALDYETTESYSLQVVATDANTPPETNILTLTVNVGDANDNAPIFTPGQIITATIPETQTAADGTILRITADDDDATAPNNAVRYEITDGTGMGLFYINPITGDIRVADDVDLDYDTDPATTEYTLTITASDGGDNPPADFVAMTRTTTVTITLSDVNDIVPDVDFPPAGTTGTVRTTFGSADFAQNSAAGTGYSIAITDADTGNQFAGKFNVSDPRFDFIDRGNGVWELTLLAGQEIDVEIDPDASEAETITLTYEVNDGTHKIDGEVVTLEVVGKPKFNITGLLSVPVPEDVSDADALVTFKATLDEAPDLEVNYRITDGNIGGLFHLEKDGLNNAVISLVADRSLDYEILPDSYTLTVEASTSFEGESVVEDITLRIAVDNVNEYAPAFDADAFDDVDDVAENIADDHVIKRVRATDDDRGDTVRYSLAPASSALFEINDDGEITLVDGQSLDYESQAQHQVVVIAADRDNGGKTSQASFDINLMDLNDDTPILTASIASGKVRADTPGLLGGTDTGIRLILTDEDGVATNDYTSDSFTISGTEADKFGLRREIVGAHREWGLYFTGETGIDFSAISGGAITLNIAVTDRLSDGTSHTTDPVPVTIEELTSTVSFTAGKGSRSFDVMEGVEKIVGTELVTVEATSTASGPVKYAFLGGRQIFGAFSIDADSGVITYAADTSFDFEDSRPNPYRLNVIATDTSNNNTAPATITVNVLDVNEHAPLFASVIGYATVAESHTEADGMFAKVTARDGDGASPNNAIVRYEITGGTGMGIFKINAKGEVSLASGQTLDYDTAPTSYTLEIIATDGGGADAMTTPTESTHILTIDISDVNDITPTYTESGAAMVRMTGVHGHNYRIHTGYSITIDDADTNNVFTFNLSDPNRFEFRDQGNGVWGLFVIPDRVFDLAEGTITLTYQLRDGNNDAVDENGMVRSGSVNVEVVATSVRFIENMGDQSVDVMEGKTQMAGAQLAVVEAVALASGTVSYALAEASDLFSIDETTGIITYIADTNFDFEMQDKYTLKIVATNDGNGINGTHVGDTATATITINVGDANEHAPTFPATLTATVADAHTAADGVFTTITANDADGSAPNNVVRYDITGGNRDDSFTIDPDSGGISVAAGKILAHGVYTLEITATDGGAPLLSSTHDITITVTQSGSVAAEYSLSQTGRTLTANLDTPDPDGIKAATTPRYQWFSLDSGTVLDTTNTENYTLPNDADTDGYYGVIITYTDGSDVRESVVAYNFDKSVHVTPIDKDPTPQTTLTADAENLYIGDDEANTATAPGIRNDAFFGFGGRDTFQGAGWNDVFYGGADVDIFWGGAGSDAFVLDFDHDSSANGNADIVADFTHHGPHDYDRIRVYVDDPAAITTVDALKTALKITFGKAQTSLFRDAADDRDIDNLYIYNSSGDILLEIEDFFDGTKSTLSADDAITLDMFEILSKAEKPTAAAHHLEITEHKGGANPLPQSVLTMQSLKGATATIQGAHSDLFEVRGNGLGTFHLFIKENALLDHDTHGIIAFNIFFSEVKDVSGARVESFDAQRVEITVTEGKAEYAITETESGALEVALVPGKEDPDGVVGTPSYQWFKIENGMDVNVAGTDASYTPAADDAALTHGVVVSYTDTLDVALSTTSDVRVIYSPVTFTDDEVSVRINENDAATAVASVKAESTESGGTIAYAITGGDDDNLFAIDADGKITLTRALDYEIDATAYTLEITATHSPSDATNTATVNIYVNDVNDHAPLLPPKAQVAAGLSRAIVGTSDADDPLDGIDGVVDYIDGGAGADAIDGGGGDDHILGGEGADTITLADAKGSVETIYYRFSSGDAGFVAGDGAMTVENFRYYEDNLVLIDTDARVITLDRFLHDDNVGTDDADGNLIPDGKLYLQPLQREVGTHPKSTIYLAGIKIWIDDTAALTINFAEDSQPEVRGEVDTDRFRWKDTGEPFFGTLNNDFIGEYAGYYYPQLNDNTLLHAYVADLKIIDDADLPAGFATDVFISESRSNADGVFITLPATDGDGSAPNHVVRYAITAGNIGDVFSIDGDGGISVAAGANLDFETTTEYTLTITATDSGVPPMHDTHTLTIGITDANDIAPVLSAIGGVVAADFAENNSAPTPELLTTLTFSIADTDADNDFTFRVTAGGEAPTAAQNTLAGKFEVALVNDVWTLKLKTGRTIDYESETGLDENDAITLNIVVRDGIKDSNVVPVTLTITNINDTGPTLTLAPASTYALDEQPIPADESLYAGVTLTLGSVVAGIVPDLLPRHFSVQGDIGKRFDVVAGDSADEWHIHLKAGEILEHETETQIILRVTADDGVNAPYQTGDITINVRDINNHAPILASNTPMSVEISESRTDADPAFATITARDADGTSPNNAVRYDIVSGNVGDVFTINRMTGAISVAAGKSLDFDTLAKYTLAIHASDGGTPSRVVAHNLTITLTDTNDITPTYTPAGTASIRATSGHTAAVTTGYSIVITDADTNNNFAVTVAGDADDRFEFRAQGNGVWTLFLKAGAAVMASSPPIALTYTVSDGVNEAAEPGAVEVVLVESTVAFTAGRGNQVVYLNENDGGARPADVRATSTESGGSISYRITGDDAGLFGVNTVGSIFAIENSKIRRFDYETDATEYTIEVTATHQPSGDKATAIITLYIRDVNEHAPVFGATRVAAGVGLSLKGFQLHDTLTGTVADEYISGGSLDDTINGGGGDDHIWGGGPTLTHDTITLAETRGSAETVYYHIGLIQSTNNLVATDGEVVVHNFRYDEDNLVFINRNLQGMADLLSDARRGNQIANDGKLYMEPIIARTEGSVISHIAGIEIYISGRKAITLNFAEDSQVLFRGAERFSRDAEPFLGILDGLFQYRGYISPSLFDNTLLENYVNELKIIKEPPHEFTADIFLIESRSVADGVFATLPARDGDGSAPNNAIRYEIIDGNIGDVFAIDADGGIGVAAGKNLDYETTQLYTLTIAAIDGGTPSMRATKTLTIAVADVNDIVPTYTPSVAADAMVVLTGTSFGGNREDVSTGYSITIDDADTSNAFTFGLSDPRFEFRDQGNGVWELFLKEFQPVFYFHERTVTLNFYVDDGGNRAAKPGVVNFAVVDTALRFENNPIDWRVPGGIVLESTGGAAFPLGDLRASGGLYGKPLIFSIISVNGVAYNAAVHHFYLVDNVLWHRGTVADYETAPIRTDSTGRPFRGDTLIFGVRDESTTLESTPIQVEIANVDEGSAVYGLASSTPMAGGTLTVNRITDDPDGMVAGSETYAWTRTTADGNVVSIGTNSPTYQRVAADSGAVIQVHVSYIDASSNRLVTYADPLFFRDDFGTIANPVITGSNVGDVLHGVAGSNTINARGGDDVVYGAPHAETINGGAGDDVIHGGNGGDTIDGGIGHDTIYGGGGVDTIDGGDGNDIINAGGGVEQRIAGGDGADYFVLNSRTYFNTGRNHIRVTDYNRDQGDRIVINLEGSEWNSINFADVPVSTGGSRGGIHLDYNIYWGEGQDNNIAVLDGTGLVKASFIVGININFGTGANDVLIGGGDTDNFYGFSGDDIIFGMGDAETIYGGDGHDTIHGGVGDDTLIGDSIIVTTSGDEELIGDAYEDDHAGNDIIYGGLGNDYIRGIMGSDHVFGGQGNDYLKAGVDGVRSVIFGGDGIDYMEGDTNHYHTTYFLDTRALEDNTDIIADFRYNPGHNEENKLRVHVTERQRSLLEGTTDEDAWLARLQQTLNIRWDDSNRPKAGTELKALIAGNHIAQSREPSRHPNDFGGANTDTNTRDNVAFYHTRGTADTSDDILIMTIGKFSTNGNGRVGRDTFELSLAAADFDPNGDFKAEFSLTANADNTKLFIATTRPDPDGIRGSFQYQWYSITNSGATDTLIGIDDTISESLDISTHKLPEGMAYGVSITYTDRGGKTTTTELTTPAINIGVIGTGATESIKGGLAHEDIDGRGGNDHLWGGHDGNDTITLSTKAGDIETIYYRMTSGAGGIIATDGHDTIDNFRIGEDRLFIVDRGSIPLSLDDFMNSDMVQVKPIIDFRPNDIIRSGPGIGRTADVRDLIGVEIYLDGVKALTINFTEEIIRLRIGFIWEAIAQNYVGPAANKSGPTGNPLDEHGFITDNTLLKNYFGSGDHNNLRIVSALPDRFEEPSVQLLAKSQAVTISENTTNPNLATIQATGSGDITYRIIGGNDDNHFAIDEDTGIISLIKGLDYETAPTHELTIAAIDDGHGDTTNHHDVAVVIVNVENTNDSAPEFIFDGNGEYAEVNVSETAEAGSIVRQVTATDPDGTSEKLTFKITGSQTQNFEIDEESGIITVKAGHNLDYDTQSTRQRIEVEVTDGTQKTTTSVPITLTNANDEPPEFAGTISGFESATLEPGNGGTGGTSTGYKIGINDPDHQGFNNHEIQIQDGEDRFEFRSKASGILGRQDYELYLIEGESVEAGTITLKYRIYDGVNYADGDPQSVEITISTPAPVTPAPAPDPAPAPAPDYDDPLAGIVPLPDTDPYA